MYMRQYQKNPLVKRSNRRRNLLIVVLILVMLLALGGSAWAWSQRSNEPAKPNDSSATNDTDTKPNKDTDIDLSPATEEDKKANEAHKDSLVEEKPAPDAPSGTVKPVIADANIYGSNVEVSSYVPSIIEEGGTCTLKATKGGSTITRQVTGLRNAQNTSCPAFVIPRADFSAGTWKLVVSYSSTAHNGSSESKNLEIQ